MARDFNISKTTGACCQCGSEAQPGEAVVATVWETEDDLARHDYCPGCWEARKGEAAQPLAVWRARVPQPREKKKLFVDDEVLLQFFERLADAEEPAKINFRFVLTLILMRKKLLVYEGSQERDDGGETWRVRLRGGDRTFEVVDPHLDEEEIADVSGHLGEILEGEL